MLFILKECKKCFYQNEANNLKTMSTILRDLLLLGACDGPSMMALTGASSSFLPFLLLPLPLLLHAPRPLPPLYLSVFVSSPPPSFLSLLCVFQKEHLIQNQGNSLAVLWLGLCACAVGGTGLIPLGN